MIDNEIKEIMERHRNLKIIQTEKGVISIGDILDTINNLQAENTIIKKYALSEYKTTATAIKEEYAQHIRTAKHFDRLNAEIDRLERVNGDLIKIADARKKANFSLFAENTKLKNSLRTAKSKAHKEFAERCKKCFPSIAGAFDCFVKEMEGKNNDWTDNKTSYRT